MSWAIQVEHLSKQYRLGAATRPPVDSVYQLLERKIAEFARKWRRGTSTEQMVVPSQSVAGNALVVSAEQLMDCPEGYFWALRDVSFEVQTGDRVGIVGRNGSGKSTLLKILSRITTPTEGHFRFRGRLVSLLEVGAGFHADLSGRENILLNAQINGMSAREVRRIFDQIVDFSELGRQIDTPIKRYSSGMYMRLAFAVAAHLESEILIVDEVLAVGDAGFQKKCTDKMLEVAGRGRTLIFVSHDMEAVRKLCTHAILMEHGRIMRTETQEESESLGSSQAVIKTYTLTGHRFVSEVMWEKKDAPTFDEAVYLRRATLLDDTRKQKTTFDVSEEIVIELVFEVAVKKWPLNAHIYVESLEGHTMFFSMDNLTVEDPIREPGTYVERCTIYSPLMNEGTYKISVVVCTGSDTVHYLSNDELSFEVVDGRTAAGIRGDWTREWFRSAVRPRLDWSVERVE